MLQYDRTADGVYRCMALGNAFALPGKLYSDIHLRLLKLEAVEPGQMGSINKHVAIIVKRDNMLHTLNAFINSPLRLIVSNLHAMMLFCYNDAALLQ